MSTGLKGSWVHRIAYCRSDIQSHCKRAYIPPQVVRCTTHVSLPSFASSGYSVKSRATGSFCSAIFLRVSQGRGYFGEIRIRESMSIQHVWQWNMVATVWIGRSLMLGWVVWHGLFSQLRRQWKDY